MSYKSWRKEKKLSANGGGEIVKRRKMDDDVGVVKTEGTKASVKNEGGGQEANGFTPKLRETIKETRQLQVFESTDIWE